ncbi:MAG: MBOAT family protein [Planctomycetota bacterium]|nr:MBOAT family protein [Planctomycetota bacterium]
MLFNSYIFIFVFLPIALAGFFLIGRRGGRRIALAWLVACSFFFYGWWNFTYLSLLLFSVLFNYAVGVFLGSREGDEGGRPVRKLVLAAGVAVNLSLLGYFKYANFFIDQFNAVFGGGFTAGQIILPLGISFFTFQQIAYLVDAHRHLTREYNFLDYCLFVTFFPQLIAGPIVHHKEMLPQFARTDIYHVRARNLSVGVTIFFIGLFKKVMIADNLSLFADPIFDGAAAGTSPAFLGAWLGTLAYTFQLYFDFSGYSDMAIGLGRMFGIKLPMNFNSPYRAVNIIGFWRRWHMTLSRFLRDYVYIALGGNRKGKPRRYINVIVTMLLGGLWHGAGWTFVFWGGLHGLFLVVNHAWRSVLKHLGRDLDRQSRWGRILSMVITFLAVAVAWVFFRAESFDAATRILRAMAGVDGFSTLAPFRTAKLAIWLVVLLMVCFFAPNTQELMSRYRPALAFKPERPIPAWLKWRPMTILAVVLAVMTVITVLNLTKVNEFIYWQF